MIFLIIASLIWAFSFGLMKSNLVDLDPGFVAWARMLVAFPLFLPFFRKRNLNPKLALHFVGIGAIQYGLLYASYTYAFQYLESYQIALFTIFTPIYVSLMDSLYKHHIEWLNIAMSAVAVLGAVVLKFEGVPYGDFFLGFVLVQVANLSFAFGQLEYRRLRRIHADLVDQEVYALLYGGAVIFLTLWVTVFDGWTSFSSLTDSHVYTILFLGSIASGLGFFIWNVGAVRAHAGPLAVMNNIKLPLAVAVSLVFFGESADLLRLALGGGLMILAVYLAEHFRNKSSKA